MFKRLIATCLTAALTCSLSAAHAYQLTTPFSSEHYAINQVILDNGEKFDDQLAQMIINDEAVNLSDGKFQTTTAIFPQQSKGMAGSINEKLLAIISVTNYGSKNNNVIVNDDARYATEIGIHFTLKQLTNMVDNRVIGKLLNELDKFPIIITDFEVMKKSVDLRKNLFYSFKNKAVIIDFNAIDSMFYDKKAMNSVKKGCKLAIMGMPDRLLSEGEPPLFMAMHGAVNDINCDDAED